MALAYTLKASGVVDETTSAGQVPSEALGAITFAASSLILVCVGHTIDEDSPGGTPFLTVTASGLTFTRRANGTPSAAFRSTLEIFTAPDSSGGSRTITIASVVNRNMYGLFYAVYEVTGHDTGSPIGGTAGTAGTETDGSVSLTLSASPASTSRVFAAITCDCDPGTSAIDHGTGWTEDAQVDSTASFYGVFQAQSRTGSTSTSVAWDDIAPAGSPTVYSNARAAVEIKEGAGGTNATATPSVIATTTALPSASAGGGATRAPAVIATTTALPASARNVTAGPASIAATVAMPQWAVNSGAVPDTVAVTTTLPAPTVTTSGNATATPGVVATVVTLPAVTASGGATSTPATIATSASVPQVTVTGDASAAPAVAPVVVAVPQVTVQAGGNATVTPSSVAVAVGLPQAIPSGAANAAPGVVSATVALPASTAGSATTTTPATVTATTALPAAGVNVAAGPVTVPVTVTVPTAAAGASETVLPAVIATAAAVGAVAASVSAGPARVQVTVTLPAPTLTGVTTEWRNITVSVRLLPSRWSASTTTGGWSASL